MARKLTDYRLCLYASPAYLERMGTPRSLKDLETHDFIGYVDDLIFAPELRYLDKLVRTPQVVMRSTSLIVQRDAAIDGLGLCILPCFVAATAPGLVPVIRRRAASPAASGW
ncbi:LysR substrate-binding domain-containing protein [Tistrella bauzanensis]